MAVTTVALHGFLGRPEDWSSVRALLPDLDFRAPDYSFDPLLSPEATTLETWGEAFLRWCRHERLTFPIDLVGYSQGGRLAMHAFAAMPETIRRVILISTGPGLPETDREARFKSDEAWASRFECDAWSEVLRDWNAQPVFRGDSHEPLREGSPAARKIAAASLRNWSVAKQRDFCSFLLGHRDRVTLIAGERDSKYVETTKALAGEGLRTILVKDSGHRVLFDNPRAVAEAITSGAVAPSR